MGVDIIHGYRKNNVCDASGIGEIVMNAKAVIKMTNEDKVTLTFTVGEIKEMLLPLYEFSIFDMDTE